MENGTPARVLAVEPDRAVLELDDGRRATWTREALDQAELRLGYVATSICRAGLTVERLHYVHDTLATRALDLLAATRPRGEFQLYAAHDTLEPTVQLAEPAETAAARGPKRRAKTDRRYARHLRELLVERRLPQAWIAPEHILELRSLVRLRKTLVDQRTEWLQRIHAVLFQHGARLTVSRLDGRDTQQQLTALDLSPAAPATDHRRSGRHRARQQSARPR